MNGKILLTKIKNYNKMNLKIYSIFFLILVALFHQKVLAQQKAKFEPPLGKTLLIIGQDLGAVGGFAAPNNNGYAENIPVRAGGITTYSSMPSLGGLSMKINYGSGDICAQCITSNALYYNSTLAMGLYMVNQEKNMAEGGQDIQIKILGKWIKDTNRPVFLRIGYEFDGNWNHYDPYYYKMAFQRIVKIFDSLQVKNCAFVWQSSTSPVDDIIEGKHEDLNDWYPGDEYVDWIGYSWFLNSPKQIELTDELVNFARAHKKPVMVCESAPQGYDLANLTKRNIVTILDGPSGSGTKKKSPEEIWEEWYVPFFNYIEKNKDVVKIVSYINANWDAQPMWGPPYKEGYWGDTRVEANPVIKNKWLETIGKENWLHGSPGLFQDLGFVKEERDSGYRSR
jgi:hypothetical protein